MMLDAVVLPSHAAYRVVVHALTSLFYILYVSSHQCVLLASLLFRPRVLHCYDNCSYTMLGFQPEPVNI
jgi:hypothetical protein